MANRRLSKRIPFRKRVRYGEIQGVANINFSGYTFNISENGIGIESFRVFPRRSKILLHIYIGGNTIDDGRMDEIVVIEGVVSWVSSTLPGITPKMGIKLTTRIDHLNRIYRERANQYQS